MNIHLPLSIALCLSVFTSSLVAETLPYTFNAGDAAKASEVNANFQFFLDEARQRSAGDGNATHTVNCDENSAALKNAVEAGYPRIQVIGAECVGGFAPSSVLTISSADSSMVTIRVPATEQIRFFGGPVTFFDVNVISEKTNGNSPIKSQGANFYWIRGKLDASESDFVGYESFGGGYTYLQGVEVACNGANYAIAQNSGVLYLTDVTIVDGAGQGCRDRALRVRANGSLYFNGDVNIDVIQHSYELVYVQGGSLFNVNGVNNVIRGIGDAIRLDHGSQMLVYGTLRVKGDIQIVNNSMAQWFPQSDSYDGVIFENNSADLGIVKVTKNSTLNVYSQLIENINLDVLLSSVVELNNVTLDIPTINARRGSFVLLQNVYEPSGESVKTPDSSSAIFSGGFL